MIPFVVFAQAATESVEEAGVSQQQTLTSFLAPVSDILSTSRQEVFDLAAHRVMELVAIPGLLKGEDFTQAIPIDFH